MSGFVIIYGAVSTQASFNPQINYQGKLTDASNNVVTDGSYNFRFRLCTASLSGACSGSVVMDETYIGSDKVSVASGLFSVMLGSVSSTLDTVDFNQDLYLEVQVGGSGTPSWETLSPIKRLGSVPSAFNAQKFDGLATTSFLRSDVTNVQSIFNFTTTTNATTTGSQYIGGSLVNGTLNGLAQWFNGLAGVTSTPTVSGLTVSGGSSLSTLSVSSNATTSGYLTVGAAPTGALFTTGNLNVQNNGMFGGYVSSTGDLRTSANLTVQGTSVFTGLVSGAGFTSAFDTRITGTWRGIANGLASLGADGKVPDSQLSPLAISDTFVVADEAAMLGLSAAGMGDVAVRLDESKTYILDGTGDPTILSNWKELLSPTDAVSSVNGHRGAVTLSTDDINVGLANKYFTNALFDDRINSVWRGIANGLASLDASGKIPTAQLGALPINDTFVVAATSSLLTSGATKGDIGISTNASKTYVLQGTDPTIWANWVEIINGSSVTSVNSLTGDITLTTTNIAEGSSQYWTQGRFDTALAGATTWTGDLFVSSGNVGIGIATTSNALEVVGNASTSNHMYVGNDLYVGYSNGANSDKIYFAQGVQSLIWNVTNSRFEFSDGLYVTNNLSVSGSASSTALHVTGNATTTGYLTVGTAPSGANFTAGSLNVQDKLVVPYVSSTALTVSGNAYITGTVYAGVNNSSLGNLTSYGDSGANGGKLSLFYGATRNSTYQYWLMQPGSEVSADRFWLGTNLNNNLFTFTGGGDLMLNSGRLAVGTTTPYSKLTVWGSGTGTDKLVEFVNSASTTVFSILENGSLSAGTSTLTNLIVSNVSTSTFAGGLTVGTSQFVVQQATGNVGIGTASPNAPLEIWHSTAGQLRIHSNRSTAGDTASILFSAAGSGTSSGYNKAGIFFDTLDTTNGRGNLVFALNNSDNSSNVTTANAVMTLLATGNVGIGTTTPDSLLQVGNATQFFKVSSLGNATSSGYLSVGSTLSAGTSTLTNLIVTNNSVSTFAGGLTVNSNTLVVDAVNNSIGIATSSYSAAKLSVGGTQNTGGGDGGTGELLAIDGLLNFNSSADVGTALKIKPTVANAGTVNNFYGINIDPKSITNSAQMSGYAGIRVAEETTNTFGSSSIGFLYGNHPGGTTDYGLYLNSSDYNYLGSGNVGIGTTTPNAALQVGSATSYFKINSGNATTTGYLTVGAAPASANFTAGNLNIQNNGTFGGYVSSTSLQVNGNATTTGNLAVGAAAGGNSVIEFKKSGVLKWSVGNNISGDYFSISTSTLGTQNILTISPDNGNVTVGNVAASSTSKFSVYVTASVWGGVNNTTGAWMNGSDLTLKTNITNLALESPLQKLLGLRPVRYDWKTDSTVGPGKHIGFIAQEVEALYPELVMTGGNGLKSLSYAEFAPIFAGAIQEQQQEINLLKAQLSSTTPVTQDQSVQNTIIVATASNQFDSLSVSGASAFYGTITVIGEAGFSSKVTFEREVEFKDHITVDADTAGTIMIAIGATSTKVVFNKPYGLMPRIVANMQSSGTPVFMPYLIADKSTTSFSIILQDIAPADLYFDWIALAAKDREGQVAGVAETAIIGCMDASANNYNALATQADGSCAYKTESLPESSSAILEVTPPAGQDSTTSTEPVIEPVNPAPAEEIPVASPLVAEESVAPQANPETVVEPAAPAVEASPITP